MGAKAQPVRRTVGALCALLTALVLTAGCAAGSSDTPGAATGQSTPPVPTGNTLDQKLPPVAASTRLVDQDGRAFTLRSLRGKVVVLAPLLTMCQETCPMTTANIHRAAQDAVRSGASGDVVYLELTVDPDRDTVHRMHAYAELYGALPDWRLATGRPGEVRAVWKSLGVITDKAPVHGPVRDWLTGKRLKHSYDVHHQDVVMAISGAGRLRWITVGHPDARGTRLPATLQSYLNEEGRTNYAHPDSGGADSWTAHDVEQAVTWLRGLQSDG